MAWPPSFSIAFLGQQKTHGQLTAANEISSVYLNYIFVSFLRNHPDVRSGTKYAYVYIYILYYIILYYIILYYIILYYIILRKQCKGLNKTKQD